MPAWALLETAHIYSCLIEISRSWSGLRKDTLLRDGATNVETVPMTFRHKDEYVEAELPEIGWQDALSQLGRLNDSVRDDHGDVGHVQAKPTVGAMARVMGLIRCSIDKPTLSRRFNLDEQQQTVLLGAKHASDETTRKSRSCYHISGAMLDRDSTSSSGNGCFCHRASQSSAL